MRNTVSKKIIIMFLTIAIVVSMSALQSIALEYSSTNFSVGDPVITSGLKNIASTGFGLGQSIGQSVIGKSISNNFQVWSGFQYYASANPFVLAGTAGSAQVALSWTPPQTYLGARVASYELGIGTLSGSYVFTDIGNNTSTTKTGLANGIPYYFIVKAKNASGKTLSFSNEIVRTPIVNTNSGGGGGTGGGGGGGGGTTPTGNATLKIKGLAYPGVQVTILKDGAQQVVTIADQGALFSVTIQNLVASHYTFAVYATDKEGRKSTAYSFPVVLADSVTVEIDNVFLAPTIAVDNSMVKKGDPIGIFGTAAPNAQVNVHVHSSPEYIEKVVATSVGTWFKQFDTSFLELGDHITFSRQVKGVQVTDVSQSIPFIVGDRTVKKESTCGRSDLNCDKKVNITDLSMLLYYWKKTVDPLKVRADINKDGIVNTTDFSMLLYDWTG